MNYVVKYRQHASGDIQRRMMSMASTVARLRLTANHMIEGIIEPGMFLQVVPERDWSYRQNQLLYDTAFANGKDLAAGRDLIDLIKGTVNGPMSDPEKVACIGALITGWEMNRR